MNSRSCALAAASVAAMAWSVAGAARAEPAPEPPSTTVDTVVVTARRDPEDPPVVAAARARLSETPGAVSVVAAESLRDRYAQGLAETLRDVPGVFAQRKWGDDMRLSIRGSGIGNPNHLRGVLLAQDGVPFNEADGFGDYQLIDPLIARYVEVYRGGNALRFGGAQLGGAINFVTPTGRTASQENLLRLDLGSYGSVRTHGEFARLWGDWDLFAAATGLHADGWRDQSRSDVSRLSLNVGRRLGSDGEVRVILNAQAVSQEIPGSLTLREALDTPRIANAANRAGNYQRDMRSVRGALQASWRFSDDLSFDGGVFANWKDLFHPIFQVIDQESRNWGGFGRFDWNGSAFGRRADAYFGAYARFGDLDARQWINRAGSRGALTAQSRQNATGVDLFAEGRLWATDRLALVAGGSSGQATRLYANLVNRAQTADITYNWFSPRIGLLWQDEDGVQVFANLTRSVEPPNLASVIQVGVGSATFVPIRPQEAWTGEVGTRGHRGEFTWDVTAYRAQLSGELLNFVVSQAVPAATFNAGDTVHQGVEAALDWDFAPRWRLRQVYTFSDFRFDGDRTYGDHRLPVVPEHLYRLALRYRDPAGWWLEPNLEWSPRDVWVDYANTLKSPGYAVLNLGAGYRLAGGLSFYVDARNLTDERYVSNVTAVTDARIASTAVFYPGDTRSVFAGLSYAF